MNKLALLFGLLASTSAFAAAKSDGPQGHGNFRRAEVIRAAGADSKKAYVMGMATAAGHISGTKAHQQSRVQVVAAGGKVTLVKAPIDKSKPVRKLTAGEAKSYGLITQARARQLASHNGGVYASKKIVLADAGLAGSSYRFRQVSPDGFTVTAWGNKYKATKIDRTVTITGTGESASGSLERITPPVLKNK